MDGPLVRGRLQASTRALASSEHTHCAKLADSGLATRAGLLNGKLAPPAWRARCRRHRPAAAATATVAYVPPQLGVFMVQVIAAVNGKWWVRTYDCAARTMYSHSAAHWHAWHAAAAEASSIRCRRQAATSCSMPTCAEIAAAAPAVPLAALQSDCSRGGGRIARAEEEGAQGDDVVMPRLQHCTHSFDIAVLQCYRFHFFRSRNACVLDLR